MQEKIKWFCRYAPSLGPLEGTPKQVWGTEEYASVEVSGIINIQSPAIRAWIEDNIPGFLDPKDSNVVFFGLYGLPDFYTLWRHRGRKCILWAGTDIIHFKNGYWLEEGGSIRIGRKALATWINKHCESYVENEVEAEALQRMGIEPKIVPSFMGDVNDFPLSYKPSEKIRLYTSVSGDNFEQYGWDKIIKLAFENPEIEFHFYGNTKPFRIHSIDDKHPENVIMHGRISKEQMNEEIKQMTGAIRMTEFDGFSEIIAKSLLWGQWPISLIHYPHTLSPDQLNVFQFQVQPNHAGREWLLSVVNKYPWNTRS